MIYICIKNYYEILINRFNRFFSWLCERIYLCLSRLCNCIYTPLHWDCDSWTGTQKELDRMGIKEGTTTGSKTITDQNSGITRTETWTKTIKCDKIK